MTKNLSLLLSLLLCLAACSRTGGDKVVAKVGPEKITESYLLEKLDEISPNSQAFMATKAGRKQFLDVIINEKLMLMAARKSEAARSADYRKRVASMETELKEKLRAYKDFLLVKLWLEGLREGPIKVAPAEMDEYYSKYPYAVTVEHIILPSYEEAGAVLKKVKDGADFQKTAKERSIDKDNVRLPPFIYGEFMPELEEMAFKMRPGDIQGVVKTPVGFHILKKIRQDTLPAEEARERIQRVLEKKKFDDHLAKFQARMKVEVLNDDYK